MWLRMVKAGLPPRLEERLIHFLKGEKFRREKPGGVATISWYVVVDAGTDAGTQ